MKFSVPREQVLLGLGNKDRRLNRELYRLMIALDECNAYHKEQVDSYQSKNWFTRLFASDPSDNPQNVKIITELKILAVEEDIENNLTLLKALINIDQQYVELSQRELIDLEIAPIKEKAKPTTNQKVSTKKEHSVHLQLYIPFDGDETKEELDRKFESKIEKYAKEHNIDYQIYDTEINLL